MKKFSRLLSMVLAVAMILCATAVVAFAEEPTFVIDTAEFSGYVGDSKMVWSWMSDGTALEEDVVWTSTDDTVVAISTFGEFGEVADIALIGAGSCTVTATYKGQSASMTVTVDTYDPLPFNTEYPIVDDGSGFILQFTAPEAGHYTFMVTQTNCKIYGNANGAEFSLDTAGEASYAIAYLEKDETVIVSGNAFLWETELTEANYSLKVIASPEATGYALSENSITLGFLSTSFHDNGWVFLSATPETAALPAGLTWKAADETLVELYFEGSDCYITPLKPGATTVSVYNAEEELLGTVSVTVDDISKYIKPMNWGVLYDFDPEADYNMFSFKAMKADTYTLESFSEAEDGVDSYIGVYKKTDGEWESLDYFDDQTDPDTWQTISLGFKGIFEAAEGDEFLFVLGNYDETTYSFSVTGTEASDPGYKPVKVDAKKPTCTEEGYNEHYKCSVTGLLFADAEGTRMAEDAIIPATGHKLEKVEATKDTVAHEKCSVCGALFVDGKEVTSIDNPETGDNTMLLPLAALTVLSFAGLAVTVVAKKKAY